MNNRGLSILEVTLVVLIGSVALFIVGKSMMNVTNTQRIVTERTEIELNVVNLYQHILKIGRNAEICSWQPEVQNLVSVPPVTITPAQLTCDVIFDNPRTSSSTATSVRFEKSGTNVSYQRFESGAYTTILRYPNITEFEMCDDNMAIAGTCPFLTTDAGEPQKMSTVHAANLVHTDPNMQSTANHFFRYRIKGVSPELLSTGGRNLASEHFLELHGAFFCLNNPVQILGVSDPTLAFEWGGKAIE